MPEPAPVSSPPIRFQAEVPSQQLRVTVGAKLLIGLASFLFAGLGRLGNRRLIHGAERLWARVTAALLRIELDIRGSENIETGSQYVVVSLHEGLADPVALLHLPTPIRFLVRDEMFDWPALGRYLTATGQIEVPTRATRSSLRTLYRQVEESLASGDSLAVFAQGSVLGVEVAFQEGGFRLAQRFGLQVLPIVLTGSHRVWEHPYSPTVRLDQRISVRVLPPLQPDALDAATTRALEREMKSQALGPTTAPVRRFDPDRDGWWDDYDYEIDPDFEDLARRHANRRVHSFSNETGSGSR